MESEEQLLSKWKGTNPMIDDIIEYDKSDTEIWLADFTFYTKDEGERIVPNVVCKRIPMIYQLKEGLCYNRATRKFMKHEYNELINNKDTGLKKFTIKYKQFISTVNK